MPVLIAAVVLIGVLCTLDLLLTVGVIRRLRAHTELLSNAGGIPGAPAAIGVGEEIGEFTVATVDGRSLRRELLAGETLVGFFSPDCQPCRAKLPSFVALARAMPGGRDQVLAAVVGDGDEAAEMAAELGAAARVVLEGLGGGLQQAFQVRAYPTVMKVASDGAGRVVVTDNQVALERPGAIAV